jgi:transcriptional regulator with XRE-family HTH domain
MVFGYTILKKGGCVMRICEATNLRINELRKQRRLTEYALIYQTGMPPSTVKSILHGKSMNPGIVNIKKIAEGLGVTMREFYDSDIFDELEPED